VKSLAICVEILPVEKKCAHAICWYCAVIAEALLA